MLLHMKTNPLFNSINEQDRYKCISIGNIYLHSKDLSEPKYLIVIKKCKGIETKYLNNPKALIEYSILWTMFTIILVIIIH